MDQHILEVLTAAAENDLYRVCKELDGQLSVFRTRAGHVFETHDVVRAVAGGMLGTLSDSQPLGDGVWVQRLDLSEAGLDYFLAVTA